MSVKKLLHSDESRRLNVREHSNSQTAGEKSALKPGSNYDAEEGFLRTSLFYNTGRDRELLTEGGEVAVHEKKRNITCSSAGRRK